ncbi:hypothetical protein SVIOM342S_10339 [Streptomyces violaceorubidus]
MSLAQKTRPAGKPRAAFGTRNANPGSPTSTAAGYEAGNWPCATCCCSVSWP